MTTKKKASLNGARRVVATLDQVATLFQGNHEALGIPEKVAMDFAWRCDALSDSIQGQYKAGSFDAATIAEEVPGPLVNDKTQTYMAGHFTQENFDQLEGKVESGSLATNAAKHVADPKLAALVKRLASVVAEFSKAAEEETPAKEEKKEDAEAKEDAEEAKEEEAAVKAASAFGLFSTK